MCQICERIADEHPDENIGFTLVRYTPGAIKRLATTGRGELELIPMADEDQAYVGDELDPSIVDGSDWEHYADAQIDWYCDQHRHIRVDVDKPCPLCEPEIRIFPVAH